MEYPTLTIGKVSTEFIYKEFIYGGHLLSLGAAALALSAMLLLNIDIRWEFLIIVYLGTQCLYNYDHHRGLHTDCIGNSERTSHLEKYHEYSPLVLFIYGSGFFFALLYFGTLESFLFGGLLLLSGILYTNKFKELTKKVVGFKSFYASFSVSLLVLFTTMYCSYKISLLTSILLLFLFLRFMVNTSFCDIKDMDSDRKQNLLTLALYFGKERLLRILHVINFASLAILLIGVYTGLLPLYSLFLSFFSLYSFYYIQKARNVKTNIETLSNVIVDAEYIFWPFFLLLGRFFFIHFPFIH